MKFHKGMSYPELILGTSRDLECNALIICKAHNIYLAPKATLGVKFYAMEMKKLFDEEELAYFKSWLKIRNDYTHYIIHDFNKSTFVNDFNGINSAVERLLADINSTSKHQVTKDEVSNEFISIVKKFGDDEAKKEWGVSEYLEDGLIYLLKGFVILGAILAGLSVIFYLGQGIGISTNSMKDSNNMGEFYLNEANKYTSSDKYKSDSLMLIAADLGNSVAIEWRRNSIDYFIKRGRGYVNIDQYKAWAFWKEAARYGDATCIQFCKERHIKYWLRGAIQYEN